jgi:predicted ArsR family transcriptional regulator
MPKQLELTSRDRDRLLRAVARRDHARERYRALLRELVEAGYSRAAIGRVLGVSREAVRQALEE